ncbi:MAG: hypothetical protein ACUBOA_07995 [Candidatus Loosdrechtia sp.]|uniref:hypothetical protein n=1 Tax=Candidatus Loosdrechtia sp. TaxID=3101272 RepID=UPI003A72E283|nr:MAG: hypothetical protein QY305_15085 [Candidatus Jettenia sp. AMX2]
MSDEIKYEDEKCRRFNESLDEEGDVNIANISFSRSRILFEMDFETYKQALYEFLEQDYEDLKQIIFDYYPACIAYNFRLSERGEGSTDPVRKLLHLKDSWESVIFVLYALVMGEVRRKGVDLKTTQIFVSYDAGGNPIFSSFNSDKVLSDALKQKLQNIKAIVQHVKNRAIGFKCAEIELNLFDDLLQLQEIRNDLSHHTVPTREQAETELKTVLLLFREMLTKTRFLENCKMLRFDNYSSDCRCETFNGHSLNREYDNFSFTEPHKSYVIGLGQEQIFVLWDNECFSLSPFLHFDKDATGHESYICAYKGKRQGKYWYEPVKIRTEKTFDHLQPSFNTEKDEIIKLVVP